MITIRRRLHIWEHPSLHAKEGKVERPLPVHVVFDDGEFDWWQINGNDGSLTVGIRINHRQIHETSYYDNKTLYVVASGMYAKVWLEEYEEDDEPDKLADALLGEQEETPLFNGEDVPVTDINTGATDPFHAREILRKRLEEDDERARRTPSLLGLTGDQALDVMAAATSIMLPLPPRDTLPPVKLGDGAVVQITPPEIVHLSAGKMTELPAPGLGDTRLDLMKPIGSEVKTDNTQKDS